MIFPWRVSFADTDAGGVVYHARYLEIAERARAAMLYTHGLSNAGLLEHDCILTVTRIEADFRRPARLDAALEVHSRILDGRGAQLFINQAIHEHSTLLVNLRVALACIRQNGTPRRLPPMLRALYQPN